LAGSAGCGATSLRAGSALDADPARAGPATSVSHSRPEIDTEVVVGGSAMKAGSPVVASEYETPSALN